MRRTSCKLAQVVNCATGMCRPVVEAHPRRRAAIVFFDQSRGVEEDDRVVRNRHMAVDRAKVRLVPLARLWREGLRTSEPVEEMSTTSKTNDWYDAYPTSWFPGM